MSKQGEEVRALVESERNGVLCTLSKRAAGWPFGSITPYALTGAGDPIVLISEIAEHTRNLRADARASLLVQDHHAMADPQAGARVTLLGYAMPVAQPAVLDARRRYLELFPNSAGYFEIHDFTLFQIKVLQVRFIGGFGEIYWLDGREVAAPPGASADPLAPHAEMICDHMNEDHQDALRLYAKAFANAEADRAMMISVDANGFDFVAISEAHKHVRLDFPAPAKTAEDVRAVMVDMVRRARQALAQ